MRASIPFRGGLSSSTALIAATLWTVMRHRGIAHHRHYFAEWPRYVELNRMGIVCGYQDAYMVTFGGLNYIEFRDKEFYRTVADEPYATVESLNGSAVSLPFIVAHTGVQHSSSAVHKPLRERWLDGEPAVVEGYQRIGKLAREGKRAFLDGDWERLARLMTENHAIQRDLGGSGPVNEQLIAAALDAGRPGRQAGRGRLRRHHHRAPSRSRAAWKSRFAPPAPPTSSTRRWSPASATSPPGRPPATKRGRASPARPRSPACPTAS